MAAAVGGLVVVAVVGDQVLLGIGWRLEEYTTTKSFRASRGQSNDEGEADRPSCVYSHRIMKESFFSEAFQCGRANQS